MHWSFLLYLLIAGIMIWLMVRMIKNNPDSFTGEALSKSIFTLGILALLLIGVVLICILRLKN